MIQTARDYLADRFRADAAALRDRAHTLQGGAKVPGPDIATSRAMAGACDDVAAMVSAVVDDGDAGSALAALTALIPLLQQRAAAQPHPAVRAVYAGAATRIREIEVAEARASDPSATPPAPDDLDDDAP